MPALFFADKTREVSLARRHVDREKFERADREARRVLDAERVARDAKTARLRELRLALQVDCKPAGSIPERAILQKKPARRIIEVD